MTLELPETFTSMTALPLYLMAEAPDNTPLMVPSHPILAEDAPLMDMSSPVVLIRLAREDAPETLNDPAISNEL